MDARHGKDSTQLPGGRRPSRPRRAPLAAALLALLMLSCLFGAVASAGASAAPGRPTAKAPKGTITTTKPTFKWSKAARATRYEVRVYKGSKLLVRKTGIAKLSWKSSKALPKNVSLTWKVRARNARGNGAWSRSLKFKIVTGSPAKAITAFSFQGLSPPVTGTVTEAAHTIALTVPFGTNVSALVATFTTTGASVKVGATTQVSGTTTNNFSSPFIYRVTAADASTQDYVVTVTVAEVAAKAITAFSFQGLAPPVIGVVTEANHTISLTVPYGTNVSALVATFATTGSAVKVGATTQVSGTTANDFTSPVTYTVTAADASTQDYVVTVTVAALAIGGPYQGGKVAYILQDGDPGYVAGQTHGLIAATADQTTSDGIVWATEPYWSISVPGTSTDIGTGMANTNAIIAQNGAGSTYAAGLARAYTSDGYSDWYLPSRDELYKLYFNRVAIGGFASAYYWSSSEGGYGADVASWHQYFGDGSQDDYYKGSADRVRAVRAF